MLRYLAVSVAVAGLLTVATAPAEAGSTTGTWKHWNPYMAQARPSTGTSRRAGGTRVRATAIAGSTTMAEATADTHGRLMDLPTGIAATSRAGEWQRQRAGARWWHARGSLRLHPATFQRAAVAAPDALTFSSG